MKKALLLLLSLTLLLGLFGCNTKKAEPQIGFQFYYPRATATFGSNDSVIACEFRDTGFAQEDYETHLTLYFMGPQSENLRNCFPSGVSVVSVEVSQNMVFLVLNDRFATLSGLELTTACACLTMTLYGLTNVETVQIRSVTQPLDGSETITMDISDLLLLDDSFTESRP